ncbi:hypothetical protein OHA46_32380 (plasmid) [Streptomyces sp. NBC_00708]
MFNQLGARNLERTIPRLAGLTRHLWAGGKAYGEDYHHYDKKIPVVTTILDDLHPHGPHGQIFSRFGRTSPQTFLYAIGNPRQQAALEGAGPSIGRVSERSGNACARKLNSARRSGRRNDPCVRCGVKFTDERCKAARATDWGTPADTHPTLCERCWRRALVAVQWPRHSTTARSATIRTRARWCRSGSPAGDSRVGVPENTR